MATARHDLLVQARAMFAEGRSMDQIADALGQSVRTLYRWKGQDDKNGRPWGEARENFQIHDLRGVISAIHIRLAKIACDTTTDAGAWADALQKTTNSLAAIEAKYGNVTSKLRTITELAEFCQSDRSVSDEDLRTVRRVLDAFLDHLKRSNL